MNKTLSMKNKIPILLLTKDRPTLLEKVLSRLIRYTNWDEFDLWILDNLSTDANKKIINMFKYQYPFINIYSTPYNQLALIQNEVIAKLKADFYIKIDDDILVSENWTDGFVGVFERNYKDMSFGSVTLPINGFGWIPFLDIMNLTDKFREEFPGVPLNQACMDVAVFKNPEVNEFIWNACLNIDNAAETFIKNQNGTYKDLFCPHQYSIGAIVFSHSRWEEMGGWSVQDNYHSRQKKHALYLKGVDYLSKLRGKPTSKRLLDITQMIAGTHQGLLGYEESEVFKFSQAKGYTIPVTTQSIVFHFSFGPVDQYLMNRIYSKIQF